ncbi:hypothetical protein ACEQ8H_003224 [Pleosporales sp. CAS-2024a]
MSETFLLLFSIPLSAQYHSPPADAAPAIDVGALFQHTSSRNQKVITQAVDFMVSMQTAPTCTRMAASHLMSECKLLENAPDFARARPEAYLDNVKTEYAAKLAVCELLSAQPNNAAPPPNCDILVPSSKACNRGGTWWYSRPDTSKNEKQCYPEIKEYQYVQCLKTLQSSPQYWTSFSNARQNAVVMCQASRDSIERENQLETFKNLTEVMGAVSSAMRKSTEDYEALLTDQKQFADDVREAQYRFKEDVHAVQEKALATVGTLDKKFHSFMETSMSNLVTALADNQSNEIIRIRQEMQVFSSELMAESSRFAKFYHDELEAYHEQALTSLQTNHETQLQSYNTLSSKMEAVHNTADETRHAANASFKAIVSIERQLANLSDQADHIAQGFAFFSVLPELLSSLLHRAMIAIALMTLFYTMWQYERNAAIYAIVFCSSAFVLYLCGLHVFRWLEYLYTQGADIHEYSLNSVANKVSPAQKIVGLICVGAYPVRLIIDLVVSLISAFFDRLLSSYWLFPYSNDGGVGILPSIEVPVASTSRKTDDYDDVFPDTSCSVNVHRPYNATEP